MKRMAYVQVLTAGLLALGLASLSANPTGGQVAAGSATIAGQGTAGVTINQASNIAIINWQTFSIGAGESTNFIQPSSASAALNRVLGGQTSIINGTLSANGQLYLINGNGIMVGPGGVVNANSFTASTRDISDSDFLSGNLHFTGSNSSGVQNQGTINALGGDVYLIGKTVDNQGAINAANGTAGLAAADDVMLNLNGEEHVFVSPTSTASAAAGQTAIHNSGAITAASAELKAANGNLYALAINNEGTIRATSVAQKGGRIFLTTDAGLIQNTGTLSAKSGANGGQINVTGGAVWNQKTIDASGAQGGSVKINSQNVENDGTISVQGTQGAGGSVAVTYTGNAIGDVDGLVDASGTTAGGSIQFEGTGSGSEAYLSLALNANSVAGTGGEIGIESPTIYLTGATLTANGATGGGRIFLGESDPGNGPTLAFAQNVYVSTGSTVSANATSSGAGGAVGIVATETPEFFATAEALGAGGGADGSVDIANSAASLGAHAHVSFVTGNLSNPSPGPTSTGSLNVGTAVFEFVDPDPAAGNNFGSYTLNLSANNTLITSPGDSFSASGAGAAYLFSDSNGALLSTIRGSNAGDAIGADIQRLPNDNFLVVASNWNAGVGAVTFGNASSGFIGGGGIVSASNSLVGSTSGDAIGSSGIFTLYGNGNYGVVSPNWSNGGVSEVGAVTWGSGTSGVTGVVSASNSLVGVGANDHIGTKANGDTTIDVLPNSNYLVLSSQFGGGAGAVTFVNGTTGLDAPVSAANSLVGTLTTDAVGSGGVQTFYYNDNYVVISPNWSNGGISGAGAVTFGSGTTGVSGAISATNSLIGTSTNDHVGSAGVEQLANEANYLVFSPSWGGGKGAITNQPNSAIGTVGAVSAANSLVGSSTSDEVGFNGSSNVDDVSYSGYYLVRTPNWGGSLGAVTWNPVGGTAGAVGPTNSLVGSLLGDRVGSAYFELLENGTNYLVFSPSWGGGKGAITNEPTDRMGTVGAITAGNSLLGASSSDQLGSGGTVSVVDQTYNGYYLVTDVRWGTSIGIPNAGAVTWNPASGGAVGPISAANSLVGTTSGDEVGSYGIISLYTGNYVVNTPNWNGGVGAVTWGSSETGISGPISSSISLVGSSTSDNVGSDGVTQLSNGNYVVASSNWGNGQGAVTWGNGSIGTAGVVSETNSLVGTLASNDQIGSGHVTSLNNGNYLVLSPQYGGGAGAVTWGDGIGGTTVGTVSPANSLVGTSSTDAIGSSGEGYNGVTVLSSGNYVVDSPNWNNGQGGVTWGDGTNGTSGTVGSSNSLVGPTSTEYQIGSGGITTLSNGNYLVLSPQYGGTAGAVTFASGTAATVGAVTAANSLVGSSSDDSVGSGGITMLADGNYLVRTPNWSNGGMAGVGAVTWGSEATGVSGTISATNSLIGMNAGDQVGSSYIQQLNNGANYLVLSPQWGGGAGAITDGSNASGVDGVVSAANSLVGSSSSDSIGSAGIYQLNNGANYLVLSPLWGGGKGAVTNGSDATGAIGVVSAANSLVGASTSDNLGAYGSISNGYVDDLVHTNDQGYSTEDTYYLVTTANWGGGAGAVTWNSSSSGTVGVVSAANSLVGANAGDSVGSGGIAFLPNNNYVVLSPSYASSAGAATWGSATAGVAGVVGPTNSIVGGGSNAGEQYYGTSANGSIYLIKFNTDTSSGDNARIFAGSANGPSAVPTPTNVLQTQSGVTFSVSGLNLGTIYSEFFVFDPASLLLQSFASVDSSDSAINDGNGDDLATGSSTSDAPGPRRLVTPGNGIWNIFGGLVHSGPPPPFVLHQIDLNLNPKVRVFLNQFLYINP